MELLSIGHTEVTVKGPSAGPHVAVFACIHGNEKVGVKAINKLLSSGFAISRGEVVFVLANPIAYEQSVRQVDLNLNRIFTRGLSYTEPEYVRANELMDILDTADALLDIHAYNSNDDMPFIIGNESMKQSASHYPYSIFSYGWDTLEAGDTTCYMYEQDKFALCIEAGSVLRDDDYVALAIDSINTFLVQQGVIDGELNIHDQKTVHVHTAITKQTDDFAFTKSYTEFEPLAEGEIIATDGERSYVAKRGEVILFPRPGRPVGSGVFILGTYN